jgi:phenylacetate-CoA ligase
MYNKFAFPLVRYNIEDIGKPGRKNPQDKFYLSKLAHIDGRSSEVVSLPNGGKLVVHFFTILFEYFIGIEHFQVIQEKLDQITINLVVNNQYSKDDEMKIRQELNRITGDKVNIHINYLKEIPKLPSGKRRIIISNV